MTASRNPMGASRRCARQCANPPASYLCPFIRASNSSLRSPAKTPGGCESTKPGMTQAPVYRTGDRPPEPVLTTLPKRPIPTQIGGCADLSSSSVPTDGSLVTNRPMLLMTTHGSQPLSSSWRRSSAATAASSQFHSPATIVAATSLAVATRGQRVGSTPGQAC